MTTVNSVSGGKTSAYMALHYPADINIFACVCIDAPECSPKDPTVRRYATDKLQGNFIASAEHDKTLKVMMQLEQLLGREVVWVRGKSFDQIIRKHKGLPQKTMRFCTTEMKMQPMFEYLYPRYGKVIKRIGFRGDEVERIFRMDGNTFFDSPVSCSLSSRRQKWASVDWEEFEFPLRKTYQPEIIQYWRRVRPEFLFPTDSNCMGCFHKPKEIIKKNYQDSPAHLEWFARMEKETGYFWHTDKVTYSRIFKMNFTEELDFSNFTMCNSGGCTD